MQEKGRGRGSKEENSYLSLLSYKQFGNKCNHMMRLVPPGCQSCPHRFAIKSLLSFLQSLTHTHLCLSQYLKNYSSWQFGLAHPLTKTLAVSTSPRSLSLFLSLSVCLLFASSELANSLVSPN